MMGKLRGRNRWRAISQWNEYKILLFNELKKIKKRWRKNAFFLKTGFRAVAAPASGGKSKRPA